MAVKPTRSRHRFSRGQVPDHRQVSAALEDRLAALGVPFARRDLTLRLDQPLKSVDDGLRFFRLYSRDADPREITGDFVRARLEPLGPGESMVVVCEGKYHQVRRMMASRGMTVTYLERRREGTLELGDLPRGAVRELTAEEITALEEK